MDISKIVDDLAFAYIFAAPLVIMKASIPSERNLINHREKLSDASKKRIPRPGVDTIFSPAHLDLATSPLVLVTPSSKTKINPEGRHCAWEFIDAWSNCIALIGTGFLGGDDGGTYVLCGPDYKGDVPKGMMRIDFPTNMAWGTCRNLVVTDADLEDIRQVQSGMALYPLHPETYVKREFPPFPATPDVPLRMFQSLDLDTYFNLYNHLVLENPTYDYDAPALERITPYGIGPGLTFRMAQFPADQCAAIEQAVRNKADQIMQGFYENTYEKNGWYYSHELTAHFGTDYVCRATVALTGLVANPPEMAIYLRRMTDSAGERLNTTHHYRLRFEKDAFPPVKRMGFWSITAYDMDYFLISNPYKRQRFSLSNQPRFNSDGSLDCLFQKDAPEDSSWFGNFLPCGEGDFELVLRIYLPEDAVMDHSWEPPCVERLE